MFKTFCATLFGLELARFDLCNGDALAAFTSDVPVDSKVVRQYRVGQAVLVTKELLPMWPLAFFDFSKIGSDIFGFYVGERYFALSETEVGSSALDLLCFVDGRDARRGGLNKSL